MKKMLSILLSAVMVLSISIPAFASTTDEDTFCIDNYTQHTINFAETDPNMKTRSANENTIDAAIAYVESLELSDI